MIYKNKLYEGYRSKFEYDVAKQLVEHEAQAEYEQGEIYYIQTKRYIPDFILENGIYIEVKGYFSPSDRRKHLTIKKQYPELDIRFLFQNSNTKLNKKSTFTYAHWCKRHQFIFADKTVPESWLIETNANTSTVQ